MPSSLLERAISHYGLTQRQAELAVAYGRVGKLRTACREVGYDYTTARRLLTDNPGFQAALAEYVQGLYLQDRVEARLAVVRLMRNAESERVRLDAAKWLDERAAGKAVEHHVHDHHVSTDRDAILAEIRRLSRELAVGETIEVRELTVPAPELPSGDPLGPAVCASTGRPRAPEEARPARETGDGPPPLPPLEDEGGNESGDSPAGDSLETPLSSPEGETPCP